MSAEHTRAHRHRHRHKHTHTHTHIDTYIHTHTHTHLYKLAVCQFRSVLHAANHAYMTLGDFLANVAGSKVPLGIEGLACGLVVSVVAGDHLACLHQDLALRRVVSGEVAQVWHIHQLVLHAVRDLVVGSDEATLGRPVALPNIHTGKALLHPCGGGRIGRCAANG